MQSYAQKIKHLLETEAGLSKEEITIEVPPDSKLGDFAFPCFVLSKKLKKNPMQIAAELAQKINSEKKEKIIKEVKATGPYINFFLDTSEIAKHELKQIHEHKKEYGKGKEHEKIMIEYLSPNTNKPLHLGHVRNALLGKSVSLMLQFAGHKVIQADLVNDRGIHICKSMIAYKKFGEGKTPESTGRKPDHFVGDFYILFQQKLKENPDLEQEAQEMLKKWEQNDKETVELWEKMNHWVYKGFEETLNKLGIKFDVIYHESKFYDKGKDLVLKAYDKGIFTKDENNNIIAELEKYKIPNKVVLRADGTTIYITQDIYLAMLKEKEYGIDRSVYVVGSEQNLHFQQLFKILEMLEYKPAKKCYHLSYGMVYLPEGRMKSREGNVVDADDLIEEVTEIARKAVKERYKDIDEDEIEKRASSIGLGALNFMMLLTDSQRDMTYNPKESISFEGDTGPYVQYAHARCCSILEKYGKETKKAADEKIDYSLFKTEEEAKVIKHLSKFAETVNEAAENYKPSLVARYCLELAQMFSEFYHKCQVISEDEEQTKARILLVHSVRQVLENGLNLLGIDAMERM